MKTLTRWLRRLYRYWISSGPNWRVVYPDGKRSVLMSYSRADNYRNICGGVIEFIEQER